MSNTKLHHVFLSYSDGNQGFVEALARRLRSDARLAFWLAPWHSIPGEPIQEQMEEALWQAQSCAVFVDSSGEIRGWQTEQMRVAIQTRVEDEPTYRIIPVLVPGVNRPKKRNLPRFLRRYELVEFQDLDDEQGFNRLLAGIIGKPPDQVEGYIQSRKEEIFLARPESGIFKQGHALLIGVANYAKIRPLPEIVLDDARDLRELLIDPARCAYPSSQVTQLLDADATRDNIRIALKKLASRTGENDTVIIFFSGHGANISYPQGERQYLLPYDTDVTRLHETTIADNVVTNLLHDIKVERLLVLFDCCHSGGIGDPKGSLPDIKRGLSENYYEALAQGKGRVIIASSRTEEVSWALSGMDNSLFTHFLLEALRGQANTMGDGYVRVFDIFRHLADRVPTKANQHPIFKATVMEEDFPVALIVR